MGTHNLGSCGCCGGFCCGMNCTEFLASSCLVTLGGITGTYAAHGACPDTSCTGFNTTYVLDPDPLCAECSYTFSTDGSWCLIPLDIIAQRAVGDVSFNVGDAAGTYDPCDGGTSADFAANPAAWSTCDWSAATCDVSFA